MLQLGFIRSNREKVLEGLKKKNFQDLELIDRIITSDDLRKTLQFQSDELLAKRNVASKAIGMLIAEGKKEDAEAKKAEVTAIKETIDNYAAQLAEVEAIVEGMLLRIPNLPSDAVPAGKAAEDNTVIRQQGEIPVLHGGAVPHWDLITKYDLVDFQTGVKITGSGFALYKGKGAKLQRAMIQYFLDYNIAAGYTEFIPPYVVNYASAYGTGQLPDKEGQMYHVTADDLYLIPTAEVPATNIFRDVLLQENDLPKTLTAYTPCFRREAGSYGAHVRGLNRLHQFDKVEILRVEHPSKSYEALDGMVEHVKSILEELKLPYRILKLCTGDLGFTSALTYDFEVFSTAQDRWLEISSVSNFETFQANRLKLRFKNSEGKSELAHTLNGSSLALPRVLAGILENYQTDAGIQIPEVLVPYTGFSMID